MQTHTEGLGLQELLVQNKKGTGAQRENVRRYRYAYDTWTKASACCRHLDLDIRAKTCDGISGPWKRALAQGGEKRQRSSASIDAVKRVGRYPLAFWRREGEEEGKEERRGEKEEEMSML
jgi:hypothetical protein